ncbi:MAG TPA: hypothetical protein VK966_04965 [Longimicrobiales bacterium]|nr:hypothetical protein [Longimicrobiales bacterium]
MGRAPSGTTKSEREFLVRLVGDSIADLKEEVLRELRAEIPPHIDRRLQNLEFRTGLITHLTSGADESVAALHQRATILQDTPWPFQRDAPEPEEPEEGPKMSREEVFEMSAGLGKCDYGRSIQEEELDGQRERNRARARHMEGMKQAYARCQIQPGTVLERLARLEKTVGL